MIEQVSYDRFIGATVGDYRLERLMGYSKWGPTFLVRTDAASTTYLLRFLSGPTNLGVKDRDAYLERFQHQARQIANLQHPYILPLLGYGIYRGIPYLVSPHIAMRSLRTRLAKSGPLDVFVVGRYLDQIAATLEYAHQHGVLHGDLTVDCIFIRLDGQLAVADFGVIGLLELPRLDPQQKRLLEGSEVCAPEQILGKPVGASTDVYALGAVLYHLLTGSPVFIGNTPDELAQQHLYASVPPLNQWRTDLPAGLYSIIARAMAKDPIQRFHQPGALANAYHRIADPQNRTRVPFVVPTSSAMQTQQPLATATSLPDVEISELNRSNNGSTTFDGNHGTPGPASQTPFPHTLPFFSESDPLSQPGGPRPSLLRRLQRKHVRRNVLIAACIFLLLAASSTLGITYLTYLGGATSLTGQVIFFDNQNGPPGHTNALTVVAQGLDAPPSGYQYAAWLINDQNEETLPLGTLVKKQQTFVLTYTSGSSNGQASSNLLAVGDKLEITLEQGVIKLPAGKVILVGKFPFMAFAHIQHLLVSFPQTPGKIGFLVGALEQTHLLNIQADVLQSLIASRNTIALGCVAQSIIDIIEGKQGQHYRPLAITCALQNVTATGDGFGLLSSNGYLADATEHATFAITQTDATNTMRAHAKLLAIAVSNIKGWVTTVDQDALTLRDNPADLTKVQEIATLADKSYHGVDVNGDGQIDPVVGEAGALTAYQQGQLMATLTLTPGT